MKPLKFLLIILLLLVNLFIAQPSLADRIAKNSPDYPVVVQSLNKFIQLKNNPSQTEYTREEIEQQINELKLQKYILETSKNWGECSNETGRTIAIYAHKAKHPEQNTIYYLPNGEDTDDNWDCEGIYLPNDAQVGGLDIPQGEPCVLKILDGTVLTATTNPTTDEIEFNVPLGLIKVFKSNEINWPVPNLTQADIDLKLPTVLIE